MEAQIIEAARLERSDWPARQRAKLEFARCFHHARQGRLEDALACAQRQVAICREGGVEIASLYAMSNVTLMETLLGRPAQALEHARASIARLHALGDDGAASHLYFSELIALLVLDRAGEAAAAARNAYPRLRHEGDEHRMLLPLALLNAMQGRYDIAARVEAFTEAERARSGENDSPVSPLIRERLEPLLRCLASPERNRLAKEGAALDEQRAFDLAFGDDP